MNQTALIVAPDLVACRASIAKHSRSFALASTLLGPTARDHAAAVYAWCRAADDAIDLAPLAEQAAALVEERAELDRIYGGAPHTAAGRAFAIVVAERRIPIAYPRALLDGMAMDVDGTTYRTDDDLLAYCYRVAGVVGLIMCHVLGVADDRALAPAVHLGIAMQLTNVCRDVGEDWALGRLYLPDELLAQQGLAGLHRKLGGKLPAHAREGLHAAQRVLLDRADRYYASARRGYRDLPARAALAIRTAARVYRAIGARVRSLGPTSLERRAVVGPIAKSGHVGAALFAALGGLRRRQTHIPTTILELTDVPQPR